MRLVFAGLLTLVSWFGFLYPLSAQELADAMVEGYLEALRDKPEAFLEDASEVILGYGRDGAIDAAGIETMIAVRRSSVRASVMRRLLVADLDNDGAITRAEVGMVMPTLAASLRSRMVMIQRQADTDGDGRVAPAELRAFGAMSARNSLSDKQAQDFRRLMLMDANADGWLSIHEVMDVVEQYRNGA